jgi:acyl-CoA thioester hydrolase
MKLPVTTSSVQVRFSDTDAMGHISSGAYINYMEVGRADFFYAVNDLCDGDVPYNAVVNINLDYLGEVIFGADVSVVTWCSKIGTKSMTISHEIIADGRVASRGHVTVVGFDLDTRKGCALPADWAVSER